MYASNEIIAHPPTFTPPTAFVPTVTDVSPEAVMLAELQHRMANEFASAMAMLMVARRRVAPNDRAAIDGAVARLGEQAGLSRLLLPPLRAGRADLRRSIEGVCLGLSRTRLADDGIGIVVDAAPVQLASRTCWMVCAVVAELVLNAAKHAFGDAPVVDGLRGSIRVEASIEGATLTIRVADDGVGLRNGRGHATGQGSAVVNALVSSLGARSERTATTDGTVVEMRLPIQPGADA
jgi:chemotaxis family two-component system sensor kinase Cph1